MSGEDDTVPVYIVRTSTRSSGLVFDKRSEALEEIRRELAAMVDMEAWSVSIQVRVGTMSRKALERKAGGDA